MNLYQLHYSVKDEADYVAAESIEALLKNTGGDGKDGSIISITKLGLVAVVGWQPVPVADAEGKTNAKIQLYSYGGSKINAIKAIRTWTGIGLKEAKELVESAPVFITADQCKFHSFPVLGGVQWEANNDPTAAMGKLADELKACGCTVY